MIVVNTLKRDSDTSNDSSMAALRIRVIAPLAPIF
jgi:hypothetical protein